MTTIGWTPYKYTPIEQKHELEFVHNVYFSPEKITDVYKNTKSRFKLCPANAQFIKNFWLIRSPFDLELNLDRKNNRCNVNQNQKFFNTFVNVRWNDFTETDLMLVLKIEDVLLLIKRK